MFGHYWLCPLSTVTRIMKRGWLIIAACATVVVVVWGLWVPRHPSHRAIPPADDAHGQWPDATGDSRRYSPLAQINRQNVRSLKVAWTYHAGFPDREHWGVYSFQTTPILIAGNLVGCSHTKEVFALDPETGKERWHFDPKMPPF